MKILLTGFDRFGSLETNPSQLIVEHLARRAKGFEPVEMIAEVLSTEFVRAGNRIVQLIRAHRPDTIVCLGVAAAAKSIHLERVALNLDDATAPDNANVSPKGKLIIPQGPKAYWSTLPIEKMLDGLGSRNIPAIISNHAGTYVCNHVFYLARHEVELMGTKSPCGFIHLPALFKATDTQSGTSLSLQKMIEAVECCLRLVM